MRYMILDNQKQPHNRRRHIMRDGKTLCRTENVRRKGPLRLRKPRADESNVPICTCCWDLAARGDISEITQSVTPEQIEASRSDRGGWTRETLAQWGVPWPPPKGWRRALTRNARHESRDESLTR